MQNKENTNIQEAFCKFVDDNAFPCVGAKAALAHDSIEFFIAGDIKSSQNDLAITKALQDFSERLQPDNLYFSFVLLFPDSKKTSEETFEILLWERLQKMHEQDRENYAWDNKVSNDPESPEFSMSIGGKAYYIIGLHPGASRSARRFSYPALVFNAHEQFEKLRADGLYDKMKQTIIERDIEANGSSNPMLVVHGERSEARQYSGKAVGDGWQCPFKAGEKEEHNAGNH